MQTISKLPLVPVWVNPDHLALSARLLMEGHGIRAIGVVMGERVVGILPIERTFSAADEVRVSDLMMPVNQTVTSSLPLGKAAQVFVADKLDIVPVVDEGKFLGLISTHDLLSELRRTWDPLTNLAWSDKMREWGAVELDAGREISILFIDLDNFGEVNKRKGHIFGDRVLIRVAALLESVADPKEIVVRYGGDEFAIGTNRDHQGALELREKLHTEAAIKLIDEDGSPITFSVGVAGGRRSKFRADTHVTSMLDELINAASRDALSRKRPKAGGSQPKLEDTPDAFSRKPETPYSADEPYRPRFDVEQA